MAHLALALEADGDSSQPGADRAASAAARVRPALEHDLAKLGLRIGDPVFVRAFKEEGILELWLRGPGEAGFRLFRNYQIAAKSGGLGPKLAEGDGQIPEGFYDVAPQAMKPDSSYHLAFNIGYPNAYDRHHSRNGSLIMIHGGRASVGCLAMTDEKIEEIYTLCEAALRAGQPVFRVQIFPFRMSEARLKREINSRWQGFWRELLQGYRLFEETKVPPDVTVRDGRYHFTAGG